MKDERQSILKKIDTNESDQYLVARENGVGWGWQDNLHPTKSERLAGAMVSRRFQFGDDTVWLRCKPPQYWGRFHRGRATRVARQLGLSPQQAAAAISVFFGPVAHWPEKGTPLRRTDEEEVWGPSIGTLLATYKRGGHHALAWMREGCPGRVPFGHDGEHRFWSRLRDQDQITGGLSRRQWWYWRLICRLEPRNLARVPFRILGGLDRLSGHSYVVATAVLKKMADPPRWRGDFHSCSGLRAEQYWRQVADFIRGRRDIRELIPQMSRGDSWFVFHGRFPFASEDMKSVLAAELEPELIAELAEGKRMRFFLRLLRQEGMQGGEVGEHTILAAARLAVWLGGKAEAFVKRSGLTLHDAGINLPTSGVTEEKARFLFRYAHKAYTAASVVKNWEGILEYLEWRDDSGEPNNPLLQKGGLEAAEAVLSAFTYEGTRHLELARVAAECHVGQAEFPELQDRWLDALERLTHQSVPAPAVQEDGELHLAQLAKDDPRAVFAGVYTGCCQHPGGIGASCAEHAHASPDGAIWAVERHGRIITQAWVWRHGDALVLDSVEATASIGDETRGRAKALLQGAAESVIGKLGVSRVFVGTGYGGVHWRELEEMSRPFGAPAYSDSSRVWQIAGGAR